jgi:hypothetical protein
MKQHHLHVRERVWIFRVVLGALVVGLCYWAILSFVRLFAHEMTIQYSGLIATASDGTVTHLLVEPRNEGEFFVFMDHKAVDLVNVTTADLELDGFVKNSGSYIKKAFPHCSHATIGPNGNLKSLGLTHFEEARVPFSNSRNGPFLELPIPIADFEKVFGNAINVTYHYSRLMRP